jgi:hypothetical protein
MNPTCAEVIIRGLSFVNNIIERGITLALECNALLTRNEEQMQSALHAKKGTPQTHLWLNNVNALAVAHQLPVKISVQN